MKRGNSLVPGKFPELFLYTRPLDDGIMDKFVYLIRVIELLDQYIEGNVTGPQAIRRSNARVDPLASVSIWLNWYWFSFGLWRNSILTKVRWIVSSAVSQSVFMWRKTFHRSMNSYCFLASFVSFMYRIEKKIKSCKILSNTLYCSLLFCKRMPASLSEENWAVSIACWLS